MEKGKLKRKENLQTTTSSDSLEELPRFKWPNNQHDWYSEMLLHELDQEQESLQRKGHDLGVRNKVLNIQNKGNKLRQTQLRASMHTEIMKNQQIKGKILPLLQILG